METCKITQGESPTRARASVSWFSRVTLATSERRTVPPVGRESSMFPTSSTDLNLASVLTVMVLEPFCTLPPGYSRFCPARNWEI